MHKDNKSSKYLCSDKLERCYQLNYRLNLHGLLHQSLVQAVASAFQATDHHQSVDDASASAVMTDLILAIHAAQ